MALEGGHLALDFVNTVGGLSDDPPSPAEELFVSYDDVATWCARLGVISEREAGSLRAAAGRDEKAARRALRRALELRELLYPIFRALADGGEPAHELLDRLRDQERSALADAHLTRAKGGRGQDAAMHWTWPAPAELTDPLRPIVHSAVELLTDGPLDRIKTCGRCRWLFIDTTKNHSRRWCSTEGCGTDEKKERYVARRRARRAGSSSG